MVLHSQPIVDLDTLILTGVEALVCCNHPQHGLLSPALPEPSTHL